MMTEYRLHSTGLVYTPGFLEWAYWGGLNDFDKMVGIVQKGYDLPYNVAADLVLGTIEYRVEGDVVVFEVEEVA